MAPTCRCQGGRNVLFLFIKWNPYCKGPLLIQPYLYAASCTCTRGGVLGPFDQMPYASTDSSHTEGTTDVIQDSVGTGLSPVIYAAASTGLGHSTLLGETTLSSEPCSKVRVLSVREYALQ